MYSNEHRYELYENQIRIQMFLSYYNTEIHEPNTNTKIEYEYEYEYEFRSSY